MYEFEKIFKNLNYVPNFQKLIRNKNKTNIKAKKRIKHKKVREKKQKGIFPNRENKPTANPIVSR